VYLGRIRASKFYGGALWDMTFIRWSWLNEQGHAKYDYMYLV